MRSKHAQLANLAQSGSGINGYTERAFAAKELFHRTGKAFLKDLAKRLGPDIGEYTVRSNMGGMAVSGEVTLHADRLYVQLHEAMFSGVNIAMLYRSCKSQKDYTGGNNNSVPLVDFFYTDGREDHVIKTMQSLAKAETQRQANAATAAA